MAASAAPSEIRWLAIDRSVRRSVARSMRDGAAVSRPRDAALAVGYCTATLDWLSQPRRLRPFQLVIALVLVADLLVTSTVPVAPLLGALIGFGFLRLRTLSLRRRLTAALNANIDVAAEFGLTPIRVQLPGHAWVSPGRRRRVLVIVLGAALVVLAYVLVAASVLVPTKAH